MDKNVTENITPESSGTDEELKRTIISDIDETEDYDYPYPNEGYTPVIRRFLYRRNLFFDAFYIAASLLIALIISLIFYNIGKAGSKDDNEINIAVEQIRKDSQLNILRQKVAQMNTEKEQLIQDRDRLQAEYDGLLAYESSAWEIDQQIEAMRNELDTINAQNQEKQTLLDQVTGDISEKNLVISNLAPGIYTVGQNISAGKYSVTGSGSITVSNSSNTVKFNGVLRADGTELTLDDGDQIQLNTRARFSPIQ